VDPAIAAITGQTSGILAAYHLNYVPDATAGLTKAFRRSSLSFRYSRSVSAGNGAYLASQSDYGSASFSYKGIRHWNFGLSGGYSRLKAIQQSIGTYEAYTAGAGMIRTLPAGLQLVLRVDERHFSTGYANFRRDAFRVSAGFMWTPGDIPLSLW